LTCTGAGGGHVQHPGGDLPRVGEDQEHAEKKWAHVLTILD
jgi:hypothetical protein